MKEELSIFQNIVNEWFSRKKVIADTDELTRNEIDEIGLFISSVIMSNNRHTLINTEGLTEVWDKYLSPVKKDTDIKRDFLFDISSEFIMRLGKTQYLEFIDTVELAFSMYNRHANNGLDVFTPMDSFYSGSMSAQKKLFEANPWFLSFMLLAYVRLED